MTEAAEPADEIVTIQSERTLWKTQQTPIDVRLPATFRRTKVGRLKSAALPVVVLLMVVAVLVSKMTGQPAAHQSHSDGELLLYGAVAVFGVVLIFGFFFLRGLMNWLANIAEERRGGAYISIDSNGLTDPRVSHQKIDWADIVRADVLDNNGICHVELLLAGRANFRPRRFRLDLRLFNGIVRWGKGAIVPIDVNYFDTDPYIISRVIVAKIEKTPRPEVAAQKEEPEMVYVQGEELRQSFSDPASGYSVVFEDDGRVAYAYLLTPKRDFVADVWLYNRCPPPPSDEWSHRARLPFANLEDYIKTKDGILPVGTTDDVEVRWDAAPAGRISASVFLRGVLAGILTEGRKPGWSANAAKDGPLALVLAAGEL